MRVKRINGNKLPQYYVDGFNTSPSNMCIMGGSHINPEGSPLGLSGNNSCVLHFGNNNYEGQMAFGFGNNTIARRHKAGVANWSDWDYVALKSDLSWKAFYDNTIESNTSDNITINLPPVTPHEYLFCLGRDNGGQIYGGHNMVINPNEDHPIIFPIYGERYNDLSHAYWGMVYIFVTTSGIYVNVLSEKNEQLRMRIYYR